MSDLVEFLRARLDEDEADARAASRGGWHFGSVESVAGGMLYDETRTIGEVYYEQPTDHDGSIVRHLLSDEADANGVHIARHDPARVLREVEAKRRIVHELTTERHVRKATDRRGVYESVVEAKVLDSWEAEVTVKALAAIYSDHPDYRDEWKP